MTRKSLTIVSVVIAVMGVIAFSWLGLTKPANQSKAPSKAHSSKAANPNEHNDIDVDFARKMIVHNQQGIQMADIAKNNTESERIRQLAASIGEELSINTKQYSDWLTEWKEPYFNLSDFPQMEGHDMYPTHPGMASLSDLSALKTAQSTTVDTLFLDLMIAHHEGAIEMANSTVFEKMQLSQMILLKKELLKKQTDEIRMMKQLQT